jgi:hypothetical protein
MKKQYYMDEDDFKENVSTQDFEHLVPKSFVSVERSIKNKALKALSLIEKKIESLNEENEMDVNVLSNKHSSLLNEILIIIKSVDIEINK